MRKDKYGSSYPNRNVKRKLKDNEVEIFGPGMGVWTIVGDECDDEVAGFAAHSENFFESLNQNPDLIRKEK